VKSDFPSKCDFCVIVRKLLKLECQLFCLQTWRESMLQHVSIIYLYRSQFWPICNNLFEWFFRIFTSSIQLSIRLIYKYCSRLEILGSILKLLYFKCTPMLNHKHMLITIKKINGNVQVQVMIRYHWF
jgi:hypothetical protein